jgi:hypothetical protein
VAFPARHSLHPSHYQQCSNLIKGEINVFILLNTRFPSASSTTAHCTQKLPRSILGNQSQTKYKVQKKEKNINVMQQTQQQNKVIYEIRKSAPTQLEV